MNVKQNQPRAAKRAYILAEALVYIVVSSILIGVGYSAMYQCIENSIALRRSADDITNALRAGERWRADVRAAKGQIQFLSEEAGQILVLPGERGEVSYQFSTNAVLRRVGSGPWASTLASVKSSSMEADVRQTVSAWRWEVELQPRFKKQGRLRPLFTFIAVPERNPAK